MNMVLSIVTIGARGIAMKALTIGKVSELTGVKVVTIRYYESVGLLPPPPRTEGNRRFYGQADVDRLVFIRRSREFGLSPEAIKSLLALELNQKQPCHSAIQIAQEHLKEVEHRISELDALAGYFRGILDRCTGERVDTCPILVALRGDA